MPYEEIVQRIQEHASISDEDLSAKIKSKSCDYLIRYFYFMTSMLFHLLWIVDKNLNRYVQFKRYLDLIEKNLLFDFLGVERL